MCLQRTNEQVQISQSVCHDHQGSLELQIEPPQTPTEHDDY